MPNQTFFKGVTLSKLEKISDRLIEEFKDYKFWLFEAEMGSGKTTLINILCRKLKVCDDITSPTYSIVNEYKTIKGENIYHFDLYRINSDSELEDLGLEEYFFTCKYCFIEWPSILNFNENFENFLKINITLNEDHTRNIEVQVYNR